MIIRVVRIQKTQKKKYKTNINKSTQPCKQAQAKQVDKKTLEKCYVLHGKQDHNNVLD